MGISTHIYLPENVRFDDVAKIVGVAVGLPVEYKKFISGNGGYARVTGMTHKNSEYSAGCGELIFNGRWAFYHFECERGGRLLSCGGSDFWAAVGRRLVDFFGGYVDYNDCDSIEIDYSRRPKPRSINAPTDGEAWENFQRRIMKVKRIRKDELNLTDNGDGTFTGEGGYTYTFDDNGLMTQEAK